MTRFAIYDDGVFVKDMVLDEKPVLIGKPFRKFYTVSIVDPAFNPTTQVRSGPDVVKDDIAETETRTFTVRAKTAQELDADKELKLDQVDMLNFEVNFDQENRIRALEGKAAITKLQYRNALKARL